MPNWLPQRLDQIPEHNVEVGLLCIIAIGLLYCFAGYRTLWFLLAASGFIVAGSTAALIAGWASNGHLLIMALMGIFGGICGAMAVHFLFKLAIFGVGGVAAALVAWELLGSRPEPWVPWALIGIATLGGLFALLLERPVLCLATAAVGAWIAARAGALLALRHLPPRSTNPEHDRHTIAIIIGVWACLAIAGAAMQFLAGRKKPAPG